MTVGPRKYRSAYLQVSLLIGLLLLGSEQIIYAQDTLTPPKAAPQVINDPDLESILTYSSRDSIYSDLKKKQVHLYGDASLNYEGIDMKADYLLIDLNKKEVFASYTLDSLGRRIGSPVFVDGTDTVHAGQLRYNFDTQKAYITDVGIVQEDIYLTMERAKRQSNEDIHFVHGKFTTCNLAEPHYHFFLSKAILVPDKRIVTGPMNLWIMGVPTPLGLPFSVIPQRKEREKKSGFIMPQISAVSDYGFGFQDLGYYIPVNERFQTTAYATLYSRGTFGLRDVSEYAKLYKFRGTFETGYQFNHPGFPETRSENVVTVRWSHEQDAKANPNWKFGASVNFNSSGDNKKVLNQQTESYFNNNMNSDIRLTRYFVGKPLQMNLKASMRQNSASSTGTVGVTAPDFNVSATRFYPFKKLGRGTKERSYQKIAMTYSLDASNRAEFSDTLITTGNFSAIGPEFMNGVKQQMGIQHSFSFFNNIVRFVPSVNYSQKYNFQTIQKTMDTVTNKAITDTLQSGAYSHAFTWSNNFTTNLYTYYRFVGKKSAVLRHVATPTVSFSYMPAIQEGIKTITDTNGREIRYSIHENSIFRENPARSSGRIDFNLTNSFELKRRSDNDTITGFRKTRIIESLILSSGYDIFADSMNWSNLNASLVMHPFEPINVTVRGTHSWYGWNDSTGTTLSQYATQTGQGIGRVINLSVATTWTITSKESREVLATQQAVMSNTWNPQYEQWLIMPSQIVQFEIPWKINLSHTFSYGLNTTPAQYVVKHYKTNNTLTISGDVSVSENWKIMATTYFDAQAGKVTNTNLSLHRNIHCWNMQFNWVPIGTNKSFTIAIRGNSAMLSNVNFNLRKPPFVF